MKKGIHIFITLLFLVTNLNLIVNKHLCMGEIKKIEIASLKVSDNCCDNNSSSEKTSLYIIEEKSCCEDETTIIQINDDYRVNNYEDETSSITLSFVTTFISLPKNSFDEKTFYIKGKEPPSKLYNRELLTKKQVLII